jgi:hypothetical protein
MKRTKEYKRTCERCQTEWYVPKEFARRPSGLEMAGAKMGSAGAQMSVVSFSRRRKQAKVFHLEEKKRLAIQAEQCPGCGSVSFQQETC